MLESVSCWHVLCRPSISCIGDGPSCWVVLADTRVQSVPSDKRGVKQFANKGYRETLI